jgi:hypothetical protein
VAEPLFLKNVSTANARCSTDQRCTLLKASNYSTQRCVSLHNLHRCRHGAKFKSSNWFCPTIEEKLFLKSVSTANARCSTDKPCMLTKGFKQLYPAMCDSLRYLHRCRHDAKLKSSNGFCPNLYISPSIFLTTDIWTETIERKSAQLIKKHKTRL